MHRRTGRPVVPAPESFMAGEASFLTRFDVALPRIRHPAHRLPAGETPPIHLRKTDPGPVVHPGPRAHHGEIMLDRVETEERGIMCDGEQMRVADGAIRSLPARGVDTVEKAVDCHGPLHPEFIGVVNFPGGGSDDGIVVGRAYRRSGSSPRKEAEQENGGNDENACRCDPPGRGTSPFSPFLAHGTDILPRKMVDCKRGIDAWGE